MNILCYLFNHFKIFGIGIPCMMICSISIIIFGVSLYLIFNIDLIKVLSSLFIKNNTEVDND